MQDAFLNVFIQSEIKDCFNNSSHIEHVSYFDKNTIGIYSDYFIIYIKSCLLLLGYCLGKEERFLDIISRNHFAESEESGKTPLAAHIEIAGPRAF